MPAASPFPTSLAPHDGLLQVHLLGLVEYGALQGVQEYNVYEISGRRDLGGVLLLAEHPTVITIGREGSRAQVRLDEEDLRQQGVEIHWVARGGGALVHAPGQLSVSLQVPLDRLGLSPAGFRELLELAVADACRELKIPARRSSQGAGLWSRNGQLAAFGAAVKSWVTCHGMFVNVALDPRLLDWTTPLVPEARWTSMQSQRLEPVRMARVREAIARQVAARFGYRQLDTATGHPLLRRKQPRELTRLAAE